MKESAHKTGDQYLNKLIAKQWEKITQIRENDISMSLYSLFDILLLSDITKV